MRIFIGYHEVAKFCSALAKALSDAGHQVHFCEILPNKYFPAAAATPVEHALRRLVEAPAGKGWLARGYRKMLRHILNSLLLLEMLLHYDAFIFVDRYSPIGLHERQILKLFGKRVVSVFLGSDSRPLYINGAFWAKFGTDFEKIGREVALQKSEVRQIEKGSDCVVCHAPSAHFLTRPFARFLALGFPYAQALDTGSPAFSGTEVSAGGPSAVRILHAPSSPEFKGTPEILKVVEELKKEGLSIHLELIAGRPNSEVLEAIRNCDFVVDEVYSDTPLAGFAVEAGQAGKLPVVGSYARETEFMGEKLPHSGFVAPEKLKDAIRHFTVDAEDRRVAGKAAKAFLDTAWSPCDVASRYLRILAGEGQEAWFSDPAGIRYLHGWGMREDLLKARLAGLIRAKGLEVLQLDDKPELAAAFEKFASGNPRLKK